MIREAGAEPLVPYPGALTRWRCKCLTCGREVRPLPSSVQQGGGACPHCSGYGFDATAPAIVYVLTHAALNAHKVGIAGVGRPGVKQPRRRLDIHRSAGWQEYRTLRFDVGADARFVEQAVLRWLRVDLGLMSYLSTGSGWTETVDADAVALPDLWAAVLRSSDRITSQRDERIQT